jgi:hypothetical protein
MSDIKNILNDDSHMYILEYEDYDGAIDYLIGLNYIIPTKDELDKTTIEGIEKEISAHYKKNYDDYSFSMVSKYLLRIDPEYIYSINNASINNYIFKILREKKYKRDMIVFDLFGDDMFKLLLGLNENQSMKKKLVERNTLTKVWSRYNDYEDYKTDTTFYPYIEMDKNDSNYATGIACINYKNTKTCLDDPKKYFDVNLRYHDTIEICKIYFYQHKNHFFKIKKITYASGDFIRGYNNIYKDYPTDVYLLESKNWASAKFAFSYYSRDLNYIYAFVKIGEKTQPTITTGLDYIVPLNLVKIPTDDFLKYLFASWDLHYYNMLIKYTKMSNSNQISIKIQESIDLTMKNLHLFGDDKYIENYFNKINYDKFNINISLGPLNDKTESIMTLCDVKKSGGFFVSKTKSTDLILTHYHNNATISKFKKAMKVLHENYDEKSSFTPMKTAKTYNELRLYYFLIESFRAHYIISQNDINKFVKTTKNVFDELLTKSIDFNVQADNKTLVLFVVVIYIDEEYPFEIYMLKKSTSKTTDIIEKTLDNFISIKCVFDNDYPENQKVFANLQSKGDFKIEIKTKSNGKFIIKMSNFSEFIKKHFDI